MTAIWLVAALFLLSGLVAYPVAGQEALPFAAPGRAGGVFPAVEAPITGRLMRFGFAPPPGVAAAPPANFRAFLTRPAEPEAMEVGCLALARRLVVAGGRSAGERELTGPLVLAFGTDATVTLIDPALRLGPAGLAGLLRLPGEAIGFVLDPAGQRLFVATAEPPTVAVLNLALRRPGVSRIVAVAPRALAWEPIGEALLVLGGDGILTAHDPDTLEPHATFSTPTATALAVIGAERLVALAGTELIILDAANLQPLYGFPLPEGPAQVLAAKDTATVFAAAGATVLAVDAAGGRLLARFPLAAPARALRQLPAGRAAAVLTDGSLAVLDAATGTGFTAVAAEAAILEAGLAGTTLYLRSAVTPRLGLLDANRLRPGRGGAPAALAEAGTAVAGETRLPLFAPLGEAMLMLNPQEQRIYLHQGMGMAAPRAAFAAGGSSPAGLAALQREPLRTAAARVEMTAEAPSPGRWRLVFALPEQGRAGCHEIMVAAEAPT